MRIAAMASPRIVQGQARSSIRGSGGTTRSRVRAAFGAVAILAFVLMALSAQAQTPSPGPASAPRPAVPHVVFVTGDDEYRSEFTMPMIARLAERAGFRTSVAYARPTPQTRDNIEGLEALESADLMVLYVRWRELPEAQMRRIVDFANSGRPVIGLRTSTHAFNYPKESPFASLNDSFGVDLFGQKWITHHGHTSTTDVTLAPAARTHPIPRGVQPFHAASWLYHVAPLAGENTILLEGDSIKSEHAAAGRANYPTHQPVAWTRTHHGGRVFFTTLGHPADFEQESMRRLIVNAIYWALGRDVPAAGADVTVPGGFIAPLSGEPAKPR